MNRYGLKKMETTKYEGQTVIVSSIGKSGLLAMATLLIVLCGVADAGEYFTTTGGIPALPVLDDTNAVSSPVGGVLIYSTADSGFQLGIELAGLCVQDDTQRNKQPAR